MSTSPVADVDVLTAWSSIAERVAQGESVPFIAHGRRIGDIVPSGELERLRETIEVLSDPRAVQDLLDDSEEGQVEGVDAVRRLVLRRADRSAQGEAPSA